MGLEGGEDNNRTSAGGTEISQRRKWLVIGVQGGW